MEDTILKPLREKERELRSKLEANPLFKQWEGIQSTISLFQNGEMVNGSKPASGNGLDVPLEFSQDLSWNRKVLFALSKIKTGFITDIIEELKRHGAKEDDDFLAKRISTMASKLKTEHGLIGSKKVGKKAKYFIK